MLQNWDLSYCDLFSTAFIISKKFGDISGYRGRVLSQNDGTLSLPALIAARHPRSGTMFLRTFQLQRKGGSVHSFTADDQGKFKTVVVLDCRGIEPNDFSAKEGWVAKATNNGKEFKEVDLSEGEWADYCDKIKEPVGVYEIEHRFERIK
ncbi:hypothetical protein KM043_014124 [Ampulex compressa]|nr:hypothetical protein KM043_014124 [Ampulex compressa]